jgi:hypothetical protein
VAAGSSRCGHRNGRSSGRLMRYLIWADRERKRRNGPARQPVDSLHQIALDLSEAALRSRQGKIGFVSQKSSRRRFSRFCLGDFRRRTPGPPVLVDELGAYGLWWF